jgi:RecJ-like exonuclease
MRDNAKNMDALTKDRALNKKVLNTVEFMKYQSQISEARSEQMKRFIPPFEALYASFSDEQKTTTDALFTTGKHGKHRMK